MELNIYVNYTAEISSLIKRFSAFDFLLNIEFPISKDNKWCMDNKMFNYNTQECYAVQVMFVGKTGYGKSTTINKIVGCDVFDTDDISSCTKDLFEADYRIDKKIPSFISFNDLPGIGESLEVDEKYLEWYRNMLEKSQVVVYVLRADQRDYSEDEKVFKTLFKDKTTYEKVIMAINYADKIEPINRKEGLSNEQIANLQSKVEYVSNIFKIEKNNIIYYSAKDQINIDLLVDKIAKKLKENMIKMNV